MRQAAGSQRQKNVCHRVGWGQLVWSLVGCFARTTGSKRSDSTDAYRSNPEQQEDWPHDRGYWLWLRGSGTWLCFCPEHAMTRSCRQSCQWTRAKQDRTSPSVVDWAGKSGRTSETRKWMAVPNQKDLAERGRQDSNLDICISNCAPPLIRHQPLLRVAMHAHGGFPGSNGRDTGQATRICASETMQDTRLARLTRQAGNGFWGTAISTR